VASLLPFHILAIWLAIRTGLCEGWDDVGGMDRTILEMLYLENMRDVLEECGIRTTVREESEV